jgi:hypothetical protein
MRVTLTFAGLPVVTATVRVVGSVLVGQGVALGGYRALCSAGSNAAELEVRDELGAALPADTVRVWPMPGRARLVVLARLGRRMAGVPAGPRPIVDDQHDARRY